MRVEWEAKDIIPGRRYSRDGISETWQIGFLSAENSDARYVSISSSDGMVTAPATKEHLAKALTDNAYLPIELLPPK